MSCTPLHMYENEYWLLLYSDFSTRQYLFRFCSSFNSCVWPMKFCTPIWKSTGLKWDFQINLEAEIFSRDKVFARISARYLHPSPAVNTPSHVPELYLFYMTAEEAKNSANWLIQLGIYRVIDILNFFPKSSQHFTPLCVWILLWWIALLSGSFNED